MQLCELFCTVLEGMPIGLYGEVTIMYKQYFSILLYAGQLHSQLEHVHDFPGKDKLVKYEKWITYI